MLGFIKKDLLLVKNNYKTILISVIIFILFSFSNNTDISFFLPFMMLVIIISTFSYDDYNKWTIYSATFPNGRKNYIKGKYIATIILIIGITLINFILSFLLFSIKHSIDLENIIISCLGCIIAILSIISILFPFLFKYGSEKGRIVMFILSILVFTFIGIISKFNLKLPSNLLSFFKDFGIYFICSLVVIMLISSYFISKKIFLKKEL